jgi:excisionase family DNA binding protein
MPTPSRHHQGASASPYQPGRASPASERTSGVRRHSTAMAYDNRTAHAPSPEHSPTAVWLSGKDAAEYVGVSWPTLRQFILDNAVPYVRLGTRWKIERTVLDASLRRTAEMTAAD